MGYRDDRGAEAPSDENYPFSRKPYVCHGHGAVFRLGIENCIACELKSLREEVERLKAAHSFAIEIVDRGVDIMTNEQIGTWSGVRAFLEMPIDGYEARQSATDEQDEQQ